MRRILALVAALSIPLSCGPPEREPAAPQPPEVIKKTEGTVVSADGVPIVYKEAGRGDLTIVFVHCGFCNRSFWSNQMEALADDYRLVALDLAGHGASGAGREAWTLGAFAEDVRAVVEALDLDPVVLVGNSLGGPVSLEAAARMPERVRGVVAVDTLHDVDAEWDAEAWRARVETFRTGYAEACSGLIEALIHPGTDAELVDFVHGTMCSHDGEFAASVLSIFTSYDMAASMEAVQAPIRAINGDLFPTDVEGNRAHAAGFEAVVLEGVGHFPQLESSEEFNRHLTEIVRGLSE